MAEKMPQTYANHARLDPWFHLFVLPVFGLALLMALVHFFAHLTEGDFHDHFHSFLLIVLAFALVVAITKIRTYALKVQDRVIRMEERQRLALLLPEAVRSRIPEFSVPQLLALRFASDAELPALAQRALAENLSKKEIKMAIKTWRPDYFRV